MASASSIEAAMQASRNAAARSLEARYRVADTISEEILARPDAVNVPDDVLEFLSGPWAQVVAQARISNRPGVSDADGFAALIPVLIWSVQPELARKSQPMLVRQVPKLVAKLREGLATIQYPEHESFAFFEALMALHERGLRSDTGSSATFAAMLDESTQPAEFRPDEFQTAPFFADSVQSDSMLPDSVFGESVLPDSIEPNPGQPAPARAETAELAHPVQLPADAELSEPVPEAPPVPDVVPAVPPVGAWVELRSDSEWKPTQLTWANPGSTLFLFTGPSGSTQSMTRRSLDKLVANGKMRFMPTQAAQHATSGLTSNAASGPTSGATPGSAGGGTPYQASGKF